MRIPLWFKFGCNEGNLLPSTKHTNDGRSKEKKTKQRNEKRGKEETHIIDCIGERGLYVESKSGEYVITAHPSLRNSGDNKIDADRIDGKNQGEQGEEKETSQITLISVGNGKGEGKQEGKGRYERDLTSSTVLGGITPRKGDAIVGVVIEGMEDLGSSEPGSRQVYRFPLFLLFCWYKERSLKYLNLRVCKISINRSTLASTSLLLLSSFSCFPIHVTLSLPYFRFFFLSLTHLPLSLSYLSIYICISRAPTHLLRENPMLLSTSSLSEILHELVSEAILERKRSGTEGGRKRGKKKGKQGGWEERKKRPMALLPLVDYSQADNENGQTDRDEGYNDESALKGGRLTGFLRLEFVEASEIRAMPTSERVEKELESKLKTVLLERERERRKMERERERAMREQKDIEDLKAQALREENERKAKAEALRKERAAAEAGGRKTKDKMEESQKRDNCIYPTIFERNLVPLSAGDPLSTVDQ